VRCGSRPHFDRRTRSIVHDRAARRTRTQRGARAPPARDHQHTGATEADVQELFAPRRGLRGACQPRTPRWARRQARAGGDAMTFPARFPAGTQPDYKRRGVSQHGEAAPPGEPLVTVDPVLEQTGPKFLAGGARGRSRTSRAARSASESSSRVGSAMTTHDRVRGRDDRAVAGQRRRALSPRGETSTTRRSNPGFSGASAACSPMMPATIDLSRSRPGAYPWLNHPNAWRPAQYPLLAVRRELGIAARHPDVLPRRSAAADRSDLFNRSRMSPRANRLILAIRFSRSPEDSWALGLSVSTSLPPRDRRSRRRHDPDQQPDDRPVLARASRIRRSRI